MRGRFMQHFTWRHFTRQEPGVVRNRPDRSPHEAGNTRLAQACVLIACTFLLEGDAQGHAVDQADAVAVGIILGGVAAVETHARAVRHAACFAFG